MKKIFGLLLCVLAFATVASANCANPMNLVTNCNFSLDLAGWTLLRGTWTQNADGSSQAGSANGISADFGNEEAQINQCIDVAPSTTYGVGFDVRLISGVTPGSCEVRVQPWSTNNCQTGTALPGSVVPASGTPTASFSQIGGADNFTSTGSTEGVTLSVRCLGNTSDGAYTVRFDDVFFGVGQLPVELQEFQVD